MAENPNFCINYANYAYIIMQNSQIVHTIKHFQNMQYEVKGIYQSGEMAETPHFCINYANYV